MHSTLVAHIVGPALDRGIDPESGFLKTRGFIFIYA